MRALRLEAYGEGGCRLRDISDPVPPGPGEVLLRVHTAPVTFATTLIAMGKYQFSPDPPFTLGIECSGTVEQVGCDVTAFHPGDQVMAIGLRRSADSELRIAGTFAERTIVDAHGLRKVPDGLDMEAAALFRSSFETAAYGLELGRLRQGEMLLVLGAGGGTGFAAVSVGKALGARVVASASTAERRALARRAGADAMLDSRSAEWRSELAALTGRHGVDCIYDPVGGEASERAFRAIAFGGRHVVIGFAAGSIPKLPLNLPLMKGASVIGANHLRGSREHPDVIEASGEKVWAMLVAGQLVLPPVAERFPLEAGAQAIAAAAAGAGAGRVVISVAGTGTGASVLPTGAVQGSGAGNPTLPEQPSAIVGTG